MIDLGPKRTPTFQGKLQHIDRRDLRVATQFLDLWEFNIEGLYYDVRVGKGVQSPPGTNKNLARMFIMNTQRRIDIVVKLIGDPILYIAEVRPHAGPGAIGNTLCTHALFKMDDPRQAQPAIITDELAQDMDVIIKKFNIKLFQTNFPRIDD